MQIYYISTRIKVHHGSPKKTSREMACTTNQVTSCVFAKIVSTLESFVIIVQDHSNLIEVILRIWYTTVYNSIKFRGVCFKDINMLRGSQNCQLVMRKGSGDKKALSAHITDHCKSKDNCARFLSKMERVL